MHCCDGFVHTSIPTDDFEDARPSAVSMAASAGCPVIFPLRVGGVAECFSPENAAHLGYIWNGTDADTVRNIVAKLRLLTNSGLTQQIASSNLAHSKDVQPKQVFTQLTKHLAP